MIDPIGKLERLGGALKHLRSSVLEGGEMGLPREEDLCGLVGVRGAPRLLLDRFSHEEVKDALELFDILPALRQKGFSEVRVCLDTSDPERQSIKVSACGEGDSLLLCETALRLGSFETEAPFARSLHGRRFQMLFILWMRLQNPLEPFTAQRPALPGQDHPGLGIGRQVMRLTLALARELGCDGLVNSPEFSHTAVIYSRRYRFLDPEAEGRLIALRRDLAHLSLVEGSWALHTGSVLLDGNPPRTYHWVPDDQVLALTEPLAAHFRSRAYLRAVKNSAKNHRFLLDSSRLAERRPLRPDGSPRVAE